MSAILALLTATILIIAAMLRTRKPREHVEQVLVQRFIHPGHAWMRVNEDGHVVVGIDDFAQSLIGTISGVTLPHLLKHVSQGSPSWRMSHGHRVIPMVSPVTGWVIEKNESILRDPSIINSSPYGEGWLFKVRPSKLSRQLNNLLSGKGAQHWQDLMKSQLSRFFSVTPALMYQDGGVLMKNLADRCSDEEWDAIVREFFHVETKPKETKQ
jgi:glycine cleavage system H protein